MLTSLSKDLAQGGLQREDLTPRASKSSEQKQALFGSIETFKDHQQAQPNPSNNNSQLNLDLKAVRSSNFDWEEQEADTVQKPKLNTVEESKGIKIDLMNTQQRVNSLQIDMVAKKDSSRREQKETGEAAGAALKPSPDAASCLLYPLQVKSVKTLNTHRQSSPSPLRESRKVQTKQCPHCTRFFNIVTASRHIPQCEKTKNRPKPPPTREQLVQSQQSRKYHLKNKESLTHEEEFKQQISQAKSIVQTCLAQPVAASQPQTNASHGLTPTDRTPSGSRRPSAINPTLEKIKASGQYNPSSHIKLLQQQDAGTLKQRAKSVSQAQLLKDAMK